MKIAFFSSKPYDEKFFNEANEKFSYDLVYFTHHLSRHTDVTLLSADAVCVFVNDTLDQEVLSALHQQGIQLVILRCAGFNNVDLIAAEEVKV